MEKQTTITNSNFLNEVSSAPGGEDIKKCYACGTCTVSCPVFEIDERYNPRKIIRMIILGMRQELLSSELIWMCANCYTCFERCPQDVKFTSIIHVLRNIAIKEAQNNKTKINSPAYFFAKSFLNSIKLHGRVWEPELIIRTMFGQKWNKKFLDIFKLGWSMFLKGRVSMFPSRIKERKTLMNIFGKK